MGIEMKKTLLFPLWVSIQFLVGYGFEVFKPYTDFDFLVENASLSDYTMSLIVAFAFGVLVMLTYVVATTYVDHLIKVSPIC